jgi:hypothetical protein
MSSFIKILLVGAELFHEDRWTWRSYLSLFAILQTRIKTKKCHSDHGESLNTRLKSWYICLPLHETLFTILLRSYFLLFYWIPSQSLSDNNFILSHFTRNSSPSDTKERRNKTILLCSPTKDPSCSGTASAGEFRIHVQIFITQVLEFENWSIDLAIWRK